MSVIDDYHTKISTVDDLSSDSEDEFPSGYLTAKFEKPLDDGDSDDSLTVDEILPFNNDIPQVEFHPLSYKERKFAEKMRKRIAGRNIRPKATLGPSASAFSDLSLNISAHTTEIDLSGQILTDASLSSLWTLISETTIIRHVALNRTGVGAHHGEPIYEALMKNRGSLESLKLKRNNLDDHAVSIILNLSSSSSSSSSIQNEQGGRKELNRCLCGGKLRILDLRGNKLSEKSGIVLANAARMPKTTQKQLSNLNKSDHSSSIVSASPLPWENSASSYHSTPSNLSSSSSRNSSSSSSSSYNNRSDTLSYISSQTFVSRFDELNGIPTEKLLNNDMEYLPFGSCGLGVAEASLIGELLKHVTSATSLDLSWNSELGADGALALAHTLSESKSPIEVLDLSGIRICDLDEKAQTIDKYNETYGGNETKEPISVDSSYQSSGVSALCFMLRSNLGIAKTLKILRLNDNCLCQPYLNKNEERVLEWQYPPNAYDRSQISENTDVLAHVLVPGVGDRLVWEWHEGIVADCRASLKKGLCDFAVNFNDNRIQRMVRRAHDKVWDLEQAKEKAAFKKQCEAAEARGRPSPAPKWAQHKPSVRILDSNIKILQESGAMFALAELLKHGIPPPATPEEIWKASQEKQMKLKEQREAQEATVEEEKEEIENNSIETLSQSVGGISSGKVTNHKNKKSSKNSNKKNTKKKKSENNELIQPEVSFTSTLNPNLFQFGGSIGSTTTASSWHISEEGIESNDTIERTDVIRDQNNEFDDNGSIGSNTSDGSFHNDRFKSMPDEVRAFEAEAENVLNTYLQEEEENENNENKLEENNLKLNKIGQLTRIRIDSVSSNEDEDDNSLADNSVMSTGSSQTSNSFASVESEILPNWAKPTGGVYGSMRVGIQKLELKRCNIDDAGVRCLALGLEHPACPVSSLHLDGNFFGGDTGALGLTNAFDLNRSLTYLGLVGCNLSQLIKREWATALNSNARSRLCCIALDSVLIAQRKLKQKYDFSSEKHKKSSSNMNEKKNEQQHDSSLNQLPNHIANKHRVSFAKKKLTEVSTAAAQGELSLENQLVKYDNINCVKLQLNLNQNLSQEEGGRKLKRLLKVGDVDQHGNRVDNVGFEEWKAYDHQETISRSVASSDCLLLASALSRNRDITGLNLAGSSVDMESFQVLVDSFSVRSRLGPLPQKRETDEDFEDDDDDEIKSGIINEQDEEPVSPLGSPTSSSVPISPYTIAASPSPPSFSTNHPMVLYETPQNKVKRPWLAALSLAGVYLGAEGCAILADAMADLTSLRYLSLRGCQLTDFGSNTESALKLISSLNGTIPLVRPPTPPPPKFGKRVKEDTSAAAATAATTVPVAPPETTTFNLKHQTQAPNKGLAGRSSSFWKVPVEPPPDNWGAPPPLRFLDLSDNGLPAPLVWRCVLLFRSDVKHMKWLDLSGNMIYDLDPVRLDVDPLLWAAHNVPPYENQLTLPMRQEVLFVGLGVDWIVQPENADPAMMQGSMALSFSSNVQTPSSKQTDDAYGEQLQILTDSACHHGAPPLFSVTGLAAVEAKVDAVFEDKPEAYVKAREELRASAWRQQRLNDLVIEIEAAKENVKYVLHRHALMDKRKELKQKADEMKAKKDKEKMELEMLKGKESDERHLMHDNDIEMLKIRQEENKIKLEQIRIEKELKIRTNELALMEKEDEDIDGYILNDFNNHKNQNDNIDDDNNDDDNNDDDDGAEDEEVIPKKKRKTKEQKQYENDKIVKRQVRKAYYQLPEAREKFEVNWCYFIQFLELLNVNHFTEEKANQISQIYFGYKNDLSKKPSYFHVYDATDLYQISELASIFYQVDLDHSGGISSDELSKCLIKLGYEMPSEKCIELLNTIDTNNDGIVSLEEFVIFFRYVKLEIRLEAEAKLVQSNIGKKCMLDLTKKLGMIVNPNGMIAKVTQGGQADISLGIKPGCRLIQCNDVMIEGLYELKNMMSLSKKQGLKTCSIVFVNPKEHARAKHELAKLKAESSKKSAIAAENAAKIAETRKLIANKNAILLIKANEELRKQAIIDALNLKKKLLKDKEDAIKLAEIRKKEFEINIRKRNNFYKAEKLRLQQEELRLNKEKKIFEENLAKELFLKETAEISAKSRLAKLRNEQDELLQEAEKVMIQTATRWGKTDLLPNEMILNKIKPNKKRRHRLRYVLMAIPQNRTNYKLFILSMAFISIFDMKKTGPGNNKKNKQQQNNNGVNRKMSRNAEVKIMTCELRCIRAWARKNFQNNSSQLLQDIRYILITRLQRSDVATWIRELLFRKSPKPKISLEHEDGSYLVYDERLGWIVRLELKTAPCNCEPCQDHSIDFPVKSRHFILPDVTGLL